jgi:hypothetical protein
MVVVTPVLAAVAATTTAVTGIAMMVLLRLGARCWEGRCSGLLCLIEAEAAVYADADDLNRAPCMLSGVHDTRACSWIYICICVSGLGLFLRMPTLTYTHFTFTINPHPHTNQHQHPSRGHAHGALAVCWLPLCLVSQFAIWIDAECAMRNAQCSWTTSAARI